MSDAKYFTKLDASNAYWKIALDQESSKLLTFNSPFRCYQFLRMPKTLKYWVRLLPHGEKVGHPSSDGFLIKMPYGLDVLHQPASHLIFSYWVG